MATKTAIAFPEPHWLVTEPEPGRLSFSPDEFFEELASWDLSINLSISALRGAMLVFDFKNYPGANIASNLPAAQHFDALVSATQTQVALMNAFAYCLHVARITEENHATDGFRVRHKDLIFTQDSPSLAMSGSAITHLQMIPGVGFSAINPPRFEAIPETTIAAACELLGFIVQHEVTNALDLVVLTNDAMVSYRDHEFSSALVTAWTVCEALLTYHWREYIEDPKRQSMTSKRSKKLTGRDFTASVITEVLELAGVVTPELLKQIDRVRAARNKWMHATQSPNREIAGDSLSLATTMLGWTLGRRLPISLSIRAQGWQ
ncbi:MAG: hypothetical protein ACRDS0_03890 [Pseudonocardiaceae bacterium]